MGFANIISPGSFYFLNANDIALIAQIPTLLSQNPANPTNVLQWYQLRNAICKLDRDVNQYCCCCLTRLFEWITGLAKKRAQLKRTVPMVQQFFKTFPLDALGAQQVNSINDPNSLLLKKIVLINRAQELAAKDPVLKKDISLSIGVEYYFKGVLEKLLERQNVPLPMWHHSTSTLSALSILDAKKLKANKAPCGTGVFLSSNPEQCWGEHTFVLGDEALSSNEAHYFPALRYCKEDTKPTHTPAPHESVFACVYQDLPIDASKVALVVTDHGFRQPKLPNELSSQRIKRVSKDLYSWIHRYLEEANKTRDLPSDKWLPSSHHWNYVQVYQTDHSKATDLQLEMPANMRHFQRTYTSKLSA